MMYKDRMSYYDMDKYTAQLYAPIDEYLRQTKRFSPKAMKKKYIWGIVGISFGILVFLAVLIGLFIEGRTISAIGISPFFILNVIMLAVFIKNFGRQPHPDMVTCENILDKDGIENVYRDYSTAREFGRRAVIGRKYLFIKKRSVVRLAQIMDCDIHVVSDDDSTTYYFRVYISDELGTRAYDVDTLDGFKKKREQKFAEMKSILEASQKRIEQIDI